MDTAVALIMFNRPDTTAQVFRAIAAAKPSTLFLIADGPRPDHPEDVERCAATRAVTEVVDWPCKVVRFYSEQNLGCGVGPAYGLSQVFEQVEEAIILEDDCIPDPSFFAFCSEMLAKYRADERVMMVSGNNFLLEQYSSEASYFFNHYAGMWGWATWRRAWQYHDLQLSSWPQLRDSPWISDVLVRPEIASYWAGVFERIYTERGTRDIWDAQWYFAMWTQHGLAITPKHNLVSNIGFGADATHTTGKNILGSLPTHALTFPLQHPRHVIRDRQADAITIQHAIPYIQPPESVKHRLKRKVLRRVPMPLRAGLISFAHFFEQIGHQLAEQLGKYV